MTNPIKLTALLASALLLSACAESFEGVGPTNDPSPVRATGNDLGRDSGSLTQLEAGIWVDPDGCQHWIVDDGVEGYLDVRRDPASGLPVCTPIAPPGSIVGESGAAGAGIRDWVPRQN
ncbi:hypothetical protein [Nioella nitratireducens]|uniref:hypothetical protein n=1 Tax=Nioella nitratireducens TaxID=1287720 RepID=UPI0008FD2D24|nr:hypothetical protein [Nioella nitratireducens]